MIKFNDSSIIVSYIKEFLYSFNLPSISADELKRKLPYYHWGEYIPNVTKTLKLENKIYDSYTHEYLGEYLRFLRDYKNIDLMSMYNCFSNNSVCVDQYIYFKIPVKSQKIYTIVTPNISYERWFTEETFDANNIQRNTQKDYIKISKPLNSNTPTTFKTIKNNSTLIIKCDRNSSHNFVILEGDYSKNKRCWGNIEFNFNPNLSQTLKNEDLTYLFSNISLLSDYDANKTVRPFASKLLEYITGNAIVNGDLISKNIVDAKIKAYIRYGGKKRNQLGVMSDKLGNEEKMRFIDSVNKSTNSIDKRDIIGYVDKDVENVLDDARRGNL